MNKIFAGSLLVTALSQTEQPLCDLALMYGVGNHGGGPTKENLDTIHQFDANPQMPRLKLARYDDFFSIVSRQRDDFPVVTEDLQYHSRGCYTSLSKVKWYNRKCEMSLMTAERLASILARQGWTDCSPQAWAGLWKPVLFSQFHDTLAKYTATVAGYGVELVDAPEELIGKIDAVMVEFQSGIGHLEYARPFLEAGIPTFVDKPFTCSVEDARELAELAAENDVPLFSSSSLRYALEIQQLKAEQDQR